MVSHYIPQRGDVVWLNFDPQKGNEIKKKRPALVISPKEYNKKTSLAIFMPITTQIKNYPFEVFIGVKEINGVILSDQVRSLDWRARQAVKITTAPENILQESISKLKLII
jgi:mRNA interferase MazF